MNSRDKIKVVSDQIGSPTWARDLCGLINTIIAEPEDHYGIYHFSGAGQCSWYEFACEIYRLARSKNLIASDCEIVPCSSDEFPTAARRPAFSLLSKEKIRQVFHYSPQEWKSSLARFLSIIDKKQESRI
jgi:dTDP-4-dehydrorhamnose reductase